MMLPADDAGLGCRSEHWNLELTVLGPLVGPSAIRNPALALKRVQTPAPRSKSWCEAGAQKETANDKVRL